MGILIAVIGGIAAIWQTARSFHIRGEERNKLLTAALGGVVIICATLTAQRQSQNSDTIKTLLRTEQQNAADLKEERTGRRDFEKAFWEFTKSLDPSKFTVRQYVTYRQAARASTAESAAGSSPSVKKISPPPAAIQAMKGNLDNWGTRIVQIGASMPGRRQDAYRRTGEFYPSYEKLPELQKQKNHYEYLLELDRLVACRREFVTTDAASRV
jgi:hypothetical protein